jgi:hypothetical protein
LYNLDVSVIFAKKITMISFEDASLNIISVHFIGNKIQEEPIKITETPLNLDQDICVLLKKYFTKFFKEQPFNHFVHESDLKFNECYSFAKEIFADPSGFHINSIKLAKHLYGVCDHPNIKSGEFYVVFFEQVYVGDAVCSALGLFKSENKDTFLKVYPENKSYTIEKEQGININKLDKGCLIFDVEAEEGYLAMAIDNTNRNDGAQFWIDKFLQIKPKEDNYYHTQNYLTMCRDFALEVFPDASLADKLSLAKESIEYFEKNEIFDKVTFHETALKSSEIIEAFEEYKTRYQEEKDIRIVDEFDVAPAALKKLKKVFKNVIKLDKNFHIYVHGNHDYIRKGFDEESGMNYYQLFFKEES